MLALFLEVALGVLLYSFRVCLLLAGEILGFGLVQIIGDLVVPVEMLPENLKKSMSDRWRQKVENTKALEEQVENE